MKSNAREPIAGFLKNFADGESMEPTSKWHLDPVKKFCDLGFRSCLGFTKQQLEAVSLLPEAKAFAACPAFKDDILAGIWPLDLTDVPERRKDLVEDYANAAFAQLRAALPGERETNVDALAQALATLCGFNDGRQFRTTEDTVRFNLCGRECRSAADRYSWQLSDASQTALLFEDKTAQANGDMSTTQLSKAAAQIIGEMISVHWKNWSHKHKPCVVYAVRLINDMAAFFRLEMTAEQIEAVCEDGVVPNPKLQVDYVPKKALEGGDEYGVSLLHPDNRLFFVKMMACIRKEMLEREVSAPQIFTSERAAKRIKSEDL